MYNYFWFLGAIMLCMLLSGYASSKVHSTYAKYGRVRNRSGLTGYDTAVRLMRNNGVTDISVGRVNGQLSDHYHPAKKIVNLSDSTYDSASVASVAVAAHEIGHVMQNKRGYLFYKIRTAIVPVVNFGSGLAMPLVMVGLIMEMSASYAGSDIGFYVAMLGVALYGLSFLFTLVTLPVELNASHRAKNMLLSEGILAEDEVKGATAVLSAAALTYLASMLTSLVYFLRFLFRVLLMFGRSNRRR